MWSDQWLYYQTLIQALCDSMYDLWLEMKFYLPSPGDTVTTCDAKFAAISLSIVVLSNPALEFPLLLASSTTISTILISQVHSSFRYWEHSIYMSAVRDSRRAWVSGGLPRLHTPFSRTYEKRVYSYRYNLPAVPIFLTALHQNYILESNAWSTPKRYRNKQKRKGTKYYFVQQTTPKPRRLMKRTIIRKSTLQNDRKGGPKQTKDAWT